MQRMGTDNLQQTKVAESFLLHDFQFCLEAETRSANRVRVWGVGFEISWLKVEGSGMKGS
jgi:hypothetical protein